MASFDSLTYSKTPDTSGAWGYLAGVSSASLVLTGSKKVLGFACHCTVAGSVSINGGTAVPIPAGSGFSDFTIGNLIDPTFVFLNTDSYYVSYVV